MSLPEGEDDLLDADDLLGGGDDLLARTDDLLREADELLEGSDELLQSADGPPTPIGSESEFEASFPRPPGSMMKQTPASVQQTPEALKATYKRRCRRRRRSSWRSSAVYGQLSQRRRMS